MVYLTILSFRAWVQGMEPKLGSLLPCVGPRDGAQARLRGNCLYPQSLLVGFTGSCEPQGVGWC